MAGGGRRWAVRPSPDGGAAGVRPRRRIRRAGFTVLVAVLALAVFGKLAYTGVARLRARAEGLPVGGHWGLDAASAGIGLAASLAALLALRAVAQRAAAQRFRGPRAGSTAG